MSERSLPVQMSIKDRVVLANGCNTPNTVLRVNRDALLSALINLPLSESRSLANPSSISSKSDDEFG